MHWGDGMIKQGHYIGFLATEYALRKQNDMDVTGILNELYFALKAINRVDAIAEPTLDIIYETSLSQNLNGFYLREDVGEDFCLNWEGNDEDFRCTNSTYYQNNNSAKINNPSEYYITKENSYQNVPSLDQLTSLMVGFSVVHKLVEDGVWVQPPGEENGYFIREEVENIVDRIIGYVSERNWQIIDVNGWMVTNGGGDLAMAAYPLYVMAHQITGNQYNVFIQRRPINIQNVQYCITGFGTQDATSDGQQAACDNIHWLDINESNAYNNLLLGEEAGPINNQEFSVYQAWLANGSLEGTILSTGAVWSGTIPSSWPSVYEDYQDNHKFDFFPWPFNTITFDHLPLTDYNNTIIFNLGVILGTWDKYQVNAFADVSGNRQLELINALLRNEIPSESKDFYKSYLDGLSDIGSYYLEGGWVDDNTGVRHSDSKFQNNGWASEYRWTHPEESVNPTNNENQGIYNGLDYMYFHNLYYLLFSDQLPEFKEEYNCFCSPEVQKPLSGIPQGATDKLNQKLSYLNNCTENVFDDVNNVVSGAFDIKPFFDEYSSYSIKPAKFQTENTAIQNGGNVGVYTNFVICNAKTLTIQPGSVLRLESGDLIGNASSVIDVYGDVYIKSNTSLKLDKGLTRLKLRSGGRIIIEDGGTFLINNGSVMEYYDGGEIIMQGSNSQFIMRSTIKMMDGGEFTINHGSNSENGKFVVEGSVAFIKDMNNNNISKVKLQGTDKSREFVVLKENAHLRTHNYALSAVTDLKISDCQVTFEKNSKITDEQKLTAVSVNFTSSYDNYGINFTDRNVFSNCNFNNVPVYANLFIENKDKFHALSCTFRNDQELNQQHPALVKVEGMGMVISNCDFFGSKISCIESKNLLYPSSIQSCNFRHVNSMGVGNSVTGLTDVSNVEIKATQCTFDHLYQGIGKAYGKLSLKCNTFSNNVYTNVTVSNGCLLNMSNEDAAGYNYLYGTLMHDASIYLHSANINLKYGRNFIDNTDSYYIYGTLVSPCGTNTDCALNAPKNQWSSTMAPPLASKFHIIGSDGLTYMVSANQTESIPLCGYYDDNSPFADLPDQAEVGLSHGNNGNVGNSGNGSNHGNGNGVSQSSLPFINTHFNPSIRLDHAVSYGLKKMKINDPNGDDLEAILVFDDIFKNELPKNNPFIKKWLDLSLSQMKSSIENAMYDGLLTKENNESVFDLYFQHYVDALNYMSDELIENKNYKEQFYLELDKSHMYRVLENYQMAEEVLREVEYCGIDKNEQEALNYWKKQYEIDRIVAQIGHAYLDTLINIDTTTYKNPEIYQPEEYKFGSKINGVYLVEYKGCDINRSSIQLNNNDFASKTDRFNGDMNIEPNPSYDNFNVTFDLENQEDIIFVEIISSDGRKVAESYLSQEEIVQGFKVVVDNWMPGTYFITGYTSNNGIYRERLIIQK